ncbi:hypothetical protein D3C78_1560660 [compost metagenome]
MHMQGHTRIALNKPFDHTWQGIARLCVGGRDIQRAFVGPGVLPCHRFNGVDFRQHFASDANDLLPRRCYLGEMFAAAGENLDPQFILKHANLLTDTGL